MTKYCDPSPRALKALEGHFVKKYEFDFAGIPLGKSLPVGIDEVKNVSVLRTLANREGKKLKRKFRVIDHGQNGYEIYYFADVPAEEE
jgi:hypothetical protein